MKDADFSFLRTFLQQKAGIALGSDKLYLADSRLSILCRRRGEGSIDALMQHLRQGRDPELETAVVDAMTTNETLFFRDQTPFTLFRDILLPEKLAANRAQRSLRIWCAAVSSGQEAYSLAMILTEMAEKLAGWRIELLGTDISGEIIAKARTGAYSQFEVQRGLPIQMLLKHFTQQGDKWQVSNELRAMVQFRQHNLLEASEAFGRFDIIFCRNVLIYFDLPTRARVLAKLAQHIAADGVLILGAAETVLGLDSPFVPDRETRGLFRRASSPAHAATAFTRRPQDRLAGWRG
jgi:chemotaxis protein methyltransferase CheR